MSAKKSSKSSKATTAEIIANNRKQITEKFVEMLSDKTLDWVKEWSGASLDGPYNPTSGVRYSGGNRLWLSMIASATGDPRFCTYKQASKRGWQVRKGSHGYLVEKFGPVYIYEKDDDGNIVRDADGRPVIAAKFYKPIATYRVFNFVDIEGVPELVKPEPMAPDAVTELMDAFIDTSDCPVIEGDGDRAFYRPGSDEIHVPSRDCFTNSTAALHTLLHEMGHSTGAASRLAREGIVDSDGFGSPKYAFEELVAELSSVFTASYVHADAMQSDEHRRNHAAYLQNWLSALNDDPNYLFKAASKAQAASEYIIDRLIDVYPDYEQAELEPVPEIESDSSDEEGADEMAA